MRDDEQLRCTHVYSYFEVESQQFQKKMMPNKEKKRIKKIKRQLHTCILTSNIGMCNLCYFPRFTTTTTQLVFTFDGGMKRVVKKMPLVNFSCFVHV